MIARLANLRKSPSVFRHLTGVTIRVFDELAAVVVPAVEETRRKTLDRPDRKRALGGGDTFDLPVIDQVLLAVIWLRQYPTNEVLGFLFGVSDSTASRAIARCVPALERAGMDTMRMPDPGRGRRKKLPAVLADTPGLAVVIDTFEQRTHRPKRRQRAYYSGKKKAHTLKSQVGVDEETGRVVDVSDSAPGPWSDMKVLKKSRLLKRLPKGVGGIGDLGYVGIGELHPVGLGASPRVALSKVAASTPPAWAAVRRPARQSEKLVAPAPVPARRMRQKARQAGDRRMVRASFLNTAFTFLSSKRFEPSWLMPRRGTAQPASIQHTPGSGGKKALNLVHQILQMERF